MATITSRVYAESSNTEQVEYCQENISTCFITMESRYF